MTRWARIAIVIGAVVVGQVVLYGPSLLGNKILLPLDLLAQPNWYLPRTPEVRAIVPQNSILSDLVLTVEPRRQFAAQELRAGRIPLWNPYNFAGSPTADLYSPFDLIYYAFPQPFMLAWLQLLKSLVAALGAYVFFRRVLSVSFWPAAIGGACYPHTGFFILWQGYTLSASIAFLPWILLATDRSIRNPRGWGGPALALLVGIVLSAEVGTTGQMLLTAGLYALWCVFDEHGWPPAMKNATRSLGVAASAVVLGAMLAMPPILPLAEYLTTGVRSAARVQGNEERPPVGIEALPQTVLPDIYGSWLRGSRRIVSGNRPESSAAAYAGVLATLVLAPLAFWDRRRRKQQVLWASIAVLGIGWSINFAGLVQILRLPGLNMLSHNRFVFIASFAVLALAVLGLSQLETRERKAGGGPWAWLWIGGLAAMAGWCLYRSFAPPELLATELTGHLASSPGPLRTRSLVALQAVIDSFSANSLRAALLCILGMGVWIAFYLGRTRAWMIPTIGALMLADLLAFGYGVAPQSDAKLSYPDIPALTKVAALPGRALCVGCLPSALNRRFSIREVRGYDGVDPARMIELLEQVADPTATVPPYARSMWFQPKWIRRDDNGVTIPPALDMLGIRHLIHRGAPAEGVTPSIQSPGYWVEENERALPRVFVPRRVVTVADKAERLALLGADDFDPREVAVVEVDLALPEVAHGSATITHETPQLIEVALDMETASLVVLADLWDIGWNATLDDAPAPILRANHAVRGVVVPAGRSTLVFQYQPRSFRIGMTLMALSFLLLATWAVLLTRRPNAPR